MTTSVPRVVRACACVCADLRTACASVTACVLMRSCRRVALRVLTCRIAMSLACVSHCDVACLRRTAPRTACALPHRLTLRFIASHPNPRLIYYLPALARALRALGCACVCACVCVCRARVRNRCVTSRVGGGGSEAPRAWRRVPTAGAGQICKFLVPLFLS